jgi:hypothetical protein
MTRVRTTLMPLVAGALGLGGLAALAAPAYAQPEADYEMPFPCGQTWTGTTRANHSPSPKSVDWNRTDDIDDPVVAAAPGVVEVAESGTSGYGRWVMLDHGNGETTIYAHLSSLAVSVGQTVDQGALLGTVGESGNATGPHLHFEERQDRADISAWFHGIAFVYGSTLTSQNCVDVPTAGNFVGGAAYEPVVFRRGSVATFQVMRAGRDPKVIKFGTSTDQPVIGDWDGDGRSNAGVRTPETKTFKLRTAAGTTSIVFGAPQDLPVAGDWDGDGTWEIGVRRAGSNVFRLRAADGHLSSVRLGDTNDLPVTGDWDGDGITDLGVYDVATATFTLRKVESDGLAWYAQVQFGAPGDLPVAGDWDANGVTDLGVWDPGTATFSERKATAPTSARATVQEYTFGNPR